MNEIPNTVKIVFQIFGCILILILISLYFTIKIYPFSDFRNYSYITKKERDKRSLKAGIGSIGFIFGFLFLIFPRIFQDTTVLGLLLQILGFGLCISPIVMPVAAFRVYKDLRSYTKMEGDIVSTDEDKSAPK
jgi:hypothetical protein